MNYILKAAIAAFFFTISFLGNSQSVKFSSTVVDFGRHNLWNNPFQSIELTNISAKPIAILRVSADRGVWYDYTRQFIKPGETVEISFAYYTEKTGVFAVPIQLYISSEMEPITIQMKGQIKGFEFDALTACPTWNKPESKPMEYERNILVLDDETGLPIKNASIELIQRRDVVGFWKTPSRGLVQFNSPNGMYSIRIQAVDYIMMQEGLSLDPTSTNLVYRLKKTVIEKPIIAIVENEKEKPIKIETEQSTIIVPPKEAPILEVVENNVPENQSVSEDLTNTLDPLSTNSTLPIEEFKPNNIIFLLDVSSSMNTPLRFPLLKRSLLELSSVMRSSDKVSLITFASSSKVLLTGMAGSQHDTLYQTINNLRPSGSTNGVKGLATAYEWAEKLFINDGNNVVILATDGAFRIVDKELNAEELVITNANKGIKLSVVGLGSDEAALTNLREIAQKGKGEYFKMSEQESSQQALINIIKSLSRRK